MGLGNWAMFMKYAFAKGGVIPELISDVLTAMPDHQSEVS
jgi:hypothetical protein